MESELSAELLESVREVVGRGVMVELKVRVQLEVKDRVEPRVLVLVPHRLLLLSNRVPTKVEQSLSLLDLQSVSSNSSSQLVLEYERGSWVLRSGTESQVDDIIAHIGLCLQRIFPGATPLKLLKKLSLKPPERTAPLLDRWGNSKPELGPCGGFSHQYWCVCDHLGLPHRDEVQWDIDTIYLTQDSRELNLQDFIHLDNRDLVPIVAALEFNQWFTKLSVKDHKLSTEVIEVLLRVVARSSRLEELLLDNTGLRSDFAQKLAVALSHNPASALHSLTLSNNSLEDKGVAALAAQLAKLPLGLKRLNLSRTGLSPKGANSLSHFLSSNPAISSSLRELNLSANSLRGDDLQLHSFLMEPNHLETLDLSYSDCSLEQVCSSLLRGSVPHLSVLNMSKCVFSHRKCKEIPVGFKQFFSSALSLSSVSVSGTKLPLDALKALLLGLGCNPNLSDVSLDLSCCDLRSAGAQILEGCIAEIPNISSLDISDNGLDMDLMTLLVWLSKNRSIRHLALGKNFNNIKSKNLSQVLDNLVLLIQEEDSPLSSLSLADSRLKSDLCIFLNALGSNSSLTRLDISGNSMGDLGAKILAKALQINTKLRTVVWDRNSVSPQGLQDVAAALEKNFTIRFMPVPIVDAAQALKTNPEKTEDALLKMEQYLLRNHETRKYLQEQNYRLQQGIVMTTTQQMMDTMCVKVQDHLNSLRFSESALVLDDVRRAQSLIQDARNSKTLLPSLYHLQNSASRGPCMGAIQDTLESMAGEVSQVMEQQLQVLLELMVQSAQSLCPHVMQRNFLQQELLQRGAKKMNIPQSFICTTLLQQSGADILNKISEVKLSLASFLSDRIVDEILESLSKSELTLAEHVSRKGRPLEHDSETEVLDERELRQETEVPQEIETQEQEVSVDWTPSVPDTGMMSQSKRKSILVRMLRPVSVAFEMEFDLDKALEEVPIHVEDLPPQPSAVSPLDGPSTCHLEPPPPELPLVHVQTLSHQTKFRPRPKKRTKPTRSKRAPPAVAVESQPDSFMEKLDEGIDEFFSKTLSRLSFKRPVATARSGSVEVEKKRESRRSGFFNYIKSRTSRSEKSHGAAGITPPTSFSPSATVKMGGAIHSTTTPPTVIKEELSPVSPTPQHNDTLHDPPSVEPQEPRQEVQSEASGPEIEPETRPETGPETGPKTGPETRPETGPETGPKTETETSSETGADKKPASLPHGPRHMGVPVLGAGLMAEMKAKLAAQKTLDSPAEGATGDAGLRSVNCLLGPDPSPDPSPDHEESRPEPAPRSKTRTSTSSGPKSPISPSVSLQACESLPSDAAPLPAPRLKRVPSHQDRDSSVSESPASPANSECLGNVFESPVNLGNTSDRPWSSLKRNQSPDSDRDERERATSLPDFTVCGADSGSVVEQSPEAEGGVAKD